MSPRPDVSEERKNQIMHAALKVFSRSGFQKARMDDIVEESGLSKGTLYWYYKNKDDIITSTLEFILNNELDEIDRIAQSSISSSELILEFVELVLADFVKMERWMSMLYELYALAARSKSLQKMFNNYFNRYMSTSVPLIQRGIDSGEFCNGTAEEIAIALGALFEGTFILKAYSPMDVDIEKHIRAGAKLLVKGITNSKE